MSSTSRKSPDVSKLLSPMQGRPYSLRDRYGKPFSSAKKFDAQLVVFDSHDADGELNEPIVIDARLMANVGAIRYSGEIADLPDMMSFGTWIDIARPAADVVELAIEWRRLLKA